MAKENSIPIFNGLSWKLNPDVKNSCSGWVKNLKSLPSLGKYIFPFILPSSVNSTHWAPKLTVDQGCGLHIYHGANMTDW